MNLRGKAGLGTLGRRRRTIIVSLSVFFVFMFTVFHLGSSDWSYDGYARAAYHQTNRKVNNMFVSQNAPSKQATHTGKMSRYHYPDNPPFLPNIDSLLNDLSPAGVEKCLKALDLRPLNSTEDYEPSARHVRYKTDVKLNSWVGNKLQDGYLQRENSESPAGDMCAEASYSPDTQHHIQVSEGVNIKDTRIKYDLTKYLNDTGYRKLVSFNDWDHWYRFSGSAVWLPRENVYIMVSRYLYAPERRTEPTFSLSRLQLFDRDWKELFGKRLRYVDVTEQDVLTALVQYGEATDDAHRYAALDEVSIEFPNIVHVPWDGDMQRTMMGPEDSKISFRPSESFGGEPIVLFNMLRPDKTRRMHASFPLRKKVVPSMDENDRPWYRVPASPLVVLHYELTTNAKGESVEKNWIPFFSDEDGGIDAGDMGAIHFLYSYDPIQILRCDMDSGGDCRDAQVDTDRQLAQQQAQKEETSEDEEKTVAEKSYLRGGTNLVAVPETLLAKIRPPDSDLMLWFGIAKSHVDRCGCGIAMYRPLLSVIAKLKGKYSLAMVSEVSEYGIPVVGWEGENTDCVKEPNVLAPNSVCSWVVPADGKKGTDYMDLTLSMADRVDTRVSLKGVGNYLLQLFDEAPFGDSITYANERGRQITSCLASSAYEHDFNYAQAHGGYPIGESPWEKEEAEENRQREEEERQRQAQQGK